MKKLISYLISLSFLTACQNQVGLTPADVSALLRPYVDSFYSYGSDYGVYNNESVVYLFEELEDGANAKCITGGGTAIITVNINKWEQLCPAQKKALIWHELGHCVLNRAHTNDSMPPSYMSPALRTCEYYIANEDLLDYELFNPGEGL